MSNQYVSPSLQTAEPVLIYVAPAFSYQPKGLLTRVSAAMAAIGILATSVASYAGESRGDLAKRVLEGLKNPPPAQELVVDGQGQVPPAPQPAAGQGPDLEKRVSRSTFTVEGGLGLSSGGYSIADIDLARPHQASRSDNSATTYFLDAEAMLGRIFLAAGIDGAHSERSGFTGDYRLPSGQQVGVIDGTSRYTVETYNLRAGANLTRDGSNVMVIPVGEFGDTKIKLDNRLTTTNTQTGETWTGKQTLDESIKYAGVGAVVKVQNDRIKLVGFEVDGVYYPIAGDQDERTGTGYSAGAKAEFGPFGKFFAGGWVKYMHLGMEGDADARAANLGLDVSHLNAGVYVGYQFNGRVALIGQVTHDGGLKLDRSYLGLNQTTETIGKGFGGQAVVRLNLGN